MKQQEKLQLRINHQTGQKKTKSILELKKKEIKKIFGPEYYEFKSIPRETRNSTKTVVEGFKTIY